jgi:hypothetical protein
LAYFVAVQGSHAIYASDAIDLAGLASPYGAMLVLGLDARYALVMQALATVLAAVCVGVVWRRGTSLPIRAAILSAATPVAVPIVMFYDLMLSGLAIAWLVRAGRADGFTPWGKTLLMLSYIMPLVSGNLQGAR